MQDFMKVLLAAWVHCARCFFMHPTTDSVKIVAITIFPGPYLFLLLLSIVLQAVKSWLGWGPGNKATLTTQL